MGEGGANDPADLLAKYLRRENAVNLIVQGRTSSRGSGPGTHCECTCTHFGGGD